MRVKVGCWRDASGRLTFDVSPLDSVDYPAACRAAADRFALVPIGEILIGPEQMFWEFGRDQSVVGLDWDIWMKFMIVAQSADAEPLAQEIAAWFESGGWRGGDSP